MSNCEKKCNTCSYRGNAIGSGHHATCNYPDMDNKTKTDISLLSIADFTTFNKVLKEQFGFTTKNHAVVNGWFSFPLDFDPAWIKGECKNHSSVRTPELLLIMKKYRNISHVVATINALVKTNQIENNDRFQTVLDAFENLKNHAMPKNIADLSPEEKQMAHLDFIDRLNEIEHLYENNGTLDLFKENKFLENSY